MLTQARIEPEVAQKILGAFQIGANDQQRQTAAQALKNLAANSAARKNAEIQQAFTDFPCINSEVENTLFFLLGRNTFAECMVSENVYITGGPSRGPSSTVKLKKAKRIEKTEVVTTPTSQAPEAHLYKSFIGFEAPPKEHTSVWGWFYTLLGKQPVNPSSLEDSFIVID